MITLEQQHRYLKAKGQHPHENVCIEQFPFLPRDLVRFLDMKKCSFSPLLQSGFRKQGVVAEGAQWLWMEQWWADTDCSFLLSGEQRLLCSICSSFFIRKAPWCIAEATHWRGNKLFDFSTARSGWKRDLRKCDMHFLRGWNRNINCRVEKRQNPGIAGRDFPPTREERQKLRKTGDGSVAHSVSNLRGRSCMQSLAYTSSKLLWNQWKPPANSTDDWGSNLNKEMQPETPVKEMQGDGRDGGAYLPNICNTSNHKCPTLSPPGSHPLPSAGGSRIAWGMSCRSQERCLPSSQWEADSPFLEVGKGRWPTSKDKEMWNNCNIYNSEVPRQATGYMLYVPRATEVLFHRIFYSSFLVYVVNHCGLTDLVQEKKSILCGPSYTDSPKRQMTVVGSDKPVCSFCLQNCLGKKLHRKCMMQFY